jgi:hypothetical protein
MWVEGHLSGGAATVKYPVPEMCCGCAQTIERFGNMHLLAENDGRRGGPKYAVYIPLCKQCVRRMKMRDRWFVAMTLLLALGGGFAAAYFGVVTRYYAPITLWMGGFGCTVALCLPAYAISRWPARLAFRISMIIHTATKRDSIWIRFRNPQFVAKVRDMEVQQAISDPLRYIMRQQ